MALATIHLSSAWYRPGLSLLVIVDDRVIVFESHLPWDHCVLPPLPTILLDLWVLAVHPGTRVSSRFCRLTARANYSRKIINNKTIPLTYKIVKFG